MDERTWVMLAHGSALISAWVALAFIGPLIVYLVATVRSSRGGGPMRYPLTIRFVR